MARNKNKRSKDEMFYEVEKVIAKKVVKKKVYYLLKWKNLGNNHNTWELKKNLNFIVDDKKLEKNKKKFNEKKKKAIETFTAEEPMILPIDHEGNRQVENAPVAQTSSNRKSWCTLM